MNNINLIKKILPEIEAYRQIIHKKYIAEWSEPKSDTPWILHRLDSLLIEINESFRVEKNILGKPPLGIKPEEVHNELRFKELTKTIKEYLDKEFTIPIKWLEEWNRAIYKNRKNEYFGKNEYFDQNKIKDKIIKAINESSLHWDRIARGLEPTLGGKNCALCQLYNEFKKEKILFINAKGHLTNNDCKGCIVSFLTGKDGCEAIGFKEFILHIRNTHHLEKIYPIYSGRYKVYCPECKRLARNIQNNLNNLLNLIPRIEKIFTK